VKRCRKTSSVLSKSGDRQTVERTDGKHYRYAQFTRATPTRLRVVGVNWIDDATRLNESEQSLIMTPSCCFSTQQLELKTSLRPFLHTFTYATQLKWTTLNLFCFQIFGRNRSAVVGNSIQTVDAYQLDSRVASASRVWTGRYLLGGGSCISTLCDVVATVM